jgi:hypothetical protein
MGIRREREIESVGHPWEGPGKHQTIEPQRATDTLARRTVGADAADGKGSPVDHTQRPGVSQEFRFLILFHFPSPHVYYLDG